MPRLEPEVPPSPEFIKARAEAAARMTSQADKDWIMCSADWSHLKKILEGIARQP